MTGSVTGCGSPPRPSGRIPRLTHPFRLSPRWDSRGTGKERPAGKAANRKPPAGAIRFTGPLQGLFQIRIVFHQVMADVIGGPFFQRMEFHVAAAFFQPAHFGLREVLVSAL